MGKSSLFNRILRRRRALVDATPGVTRDRLYADVEWRGVSFRIVDTGGLQLDRRIRLNAAMQAQVACALEESCLGLLVCDAKEGLVPLDQEVAAWIRQKGKPILAVVNKVETDEDRHTLNEFSALGFGNPFSVSSLHGLGVGELLDAVTQRLREMGLGNPSTAETLRRQTSLGNTVPKELLQVAIVGRPNVGKSSLINRILNEERVLVDDSPGTTRDPVEISFTYQNSPFCLVDTAGIRSKRRLKTRLDAVAVLKAFEAVQDSDVCVGVLDGSVGMVKDDLKLLSRVVEAGKPLCLAVNKWDLVKDPVGQKEAAEQVARRAPFLRWAPVVLTSAKTGLNVLELLDRAKELTREAQVPLAPSQARSLLQKLKGDPKAPAGIRHALLFRLTQVALSPPTFHFLCRAKRPFRRSDVAYLEGRIRRELHFTGTPLIVRLLSLNRGRIEP